MRPIITRLFLIVFLANAHPAFGQVSTLVNANFRINDDLFVAPDGTIFSSDWAGSNDNGTIVSTVHPQTGAVAPYATGLTNPLGLAMDVPGNLYVANFGNGEVTKVGPDGTQSIYGAGFDSPSGLFFSPNGILYVAEFYGHKISAISPDGSMTTFAEGSPLSNPVSLEMDENGNLYSANFYNGTIVKISPDGTTNILANLPPNLTYGSIGHLAKYGNSLVATGIGSHKLYMVEIATGEITHFAGTGVQGSFDAPLMEAQFSGPNGVAVNGDTLYISEVWTKDLRKVVLTDSTVSQINPNIKPDFKPFFHPNPAHKKTILEIFLPHDSEYEFTLTNNSGTYFFQFPKRKLLAGKNSVQFDLPTGIPNGHYSFLVKKEKRVIETASLLIIKK